MTSPYGLDQGQMQNLINQTNEAISQMTSLNANVQARAGDVYAHAQSEAGRIVEHRLMTWNTDFAAIVNALIELNGNVQQWMQTSVATAGHGSAAAGGNGQCDHGSTPGVPLQTRTHVVAPMAPDAPLQARTHVMAPMAPVLTARQPLMNQG